MATLGGTSRPVRGADTRFGGGVGIGVGVGTVVGSGVGVGSGVVVGDDVEPGGCVLARAIGDGLAVDVEFPSVPAASAITSADAATTPMTPTLTVRFNVVVPQAVSRSMAAADPDGRARAVAWRRIPEVGSTGARGSRVPGAGRIG